jgi:hypothetical protein
MKKETTHAWQDESRENLLQQLRRLYAEMESSYNQVAGLMGLSCDGCQDNCCRTHFQHHTYIEWAYLWQGLLDCPRDRRETFISRAEECAEQSRVLLEKGQRPRIMCPLNQEGWCGLYSHRLMICRMHGVPNAVTMPDGRRQHFPGCHRSQEISARMTEVPVLDRTRFYLRLAELERAFLGPQRKKLPKVDMTLAEMLLRGPPPL